MKTIEKHDFITYPRQFSAYKWYKPLLVGALHLLFFVGFGLVIELITKLGLHTVVNSTGYDDMDFFTTAGAFKNGAGAVVAIPSLLLAAMIVKDRPVSSYFSSMGGWRWKTFFKTLAAGFVIFGIPSILYFAMRANTGIKFTLGGALIMALCIPLQGIGEELFYRSYIMQTAGSWFRIPVIGLLVQIVAFSLFHPYNIIGIVEIAVSALLYGLLAIFAKGIEASSVLHILNNTIEIFMVGVGFGVITSEQTVGQVAFNLTFKALFLVFIIYAAKKLHWFDEVKKDDITPFNAKHSR